MKSKILLFISIGHCLLHKIYIFFYFFLLFSTSFILSCNLLLNLVILKFFLFRSWVWVICCWFVWSSCFFYRYDPCDLFLLLFFLNWREIRNIRNTWQTWYIWFWLYFIIVWSYWAFLILRSQFILLFLLIFFLFPFLIFLYIFRWVYFLKMLFLYLIISLKILIFFSHLLNHFIEHLMWLFIIF